MVEIDVVGVLATSDVPPPGHSQTATAIPAARAATSTAKPTTRPRPQRVAAGPLALALPTATTVAAIRVRAETSVASGFEQCGHAALEARGRVPLTERFACAGRVVGVALRALGDRP